MKYHRKRGVVKAIIFNGDNYFECKEFIEGNYDNTLRFPNVLMSKGAVEVNKGDYIIKESFINGLNMFCCCGPDEFKKTYAKVYHDTKKNMDVVERVNGTFYCPNCGKEL